MSSLLCQRFVQAGQDFIAAHQSDNDVQIRAVHDTGNGDADRHVDELAFDLEAFLDFLEQRLYRVGRDVVEGSQFIAEHLEDGRSRFFFEDSCCFFISGA